MNRLMRARALRQARRPPQPAAEPGAPLSPSAVQRGLRLSIIEGSLSNIHITATGGAFLTGFALLLGASDFELGLLAALPCVGQLFQFVGAYLEERLGGHAATPCGDGTRGKWQRAVWSAPTGRGSGRTSSAWLWASLAAAIITGIITALTQTVTVTAPVQ